MNTFIWIDYIVFHHYRILHIHDLNNKPRREEGYDV